MHLNARNLTAALGFLLPITGCVAEPTAPPEVAVAVTVQALGPSPDTTCTFESAASRDYWFCRTERSWQTARNKCQAIGLDLASIETSTENEFIRSRLPDDSWIGATDVVEGVWRWAPSGAQFWQGNQNGSPVGPYANWKSGQPNDFGSQDCAMIERGAGNGKWNDESCSITREYVCEGIVDLCPSDPSKTLPGQCGCGVADTDDDDDGTANCNDVCDDDPTKTTTDQCGCGNPDTDSDGDGSADCVDTCPTDAEKTELGVCGCGVTDADADGDGAPPCLDECPLDSTRVTEGDCGCANAPAPSGTACDDGLCAANTQCNGVGRCGSPSQCTKPDSVCSFAMRADIPYWFCENDRQFADARQRCQSVDMDLAAVESEGEDDFITDHSDEHSFLGGSDQTAEGQWVWRGTDAPFWTGDDDGSAVGSAYENWRNDEPSDTFSSYDCMVKSLLSDGRWKAHPCTNHDAFVCERVDRCPDDPDKLLPGQCGCGNPDRDLDGDGAVDCLTVEVDDTTPCMGQSVLIDAAMDSSTLDDADVELVIDGQRGSARHLQFRSPGTHLVRVSSYRGRAATGLTVKVDVQDCGAQQFARVIAVGSMFVPYTVEFRVTNADELTGTNRQFVWDFGDGTPVVTTPYPFIRHSYADSLDASTNPLEFVASLRVTRNGQADLVTPKTVTMLNLYAFTKPSGFARPPVVVTQELQRIATKLSGKYKIRNLESSPIQFTSQTVIRHFCDPDLDPEVFPAETVAFAVPAHGELERDVHFARADFGSNTCAISLELAGDGPGGLETPVSVHFETPEDGFFNVEVNDAPTLNLLNQIAADGLAGPDRITDEDLDRLFAEGRIPFIPSLGDIDTGALQSFVNVIGQECDPEEIPPFPGIRCHPTPRWKLAPPLLRNALKGDLLLVASCGEIGGMLRKVDPRQIYSHEAIMTRNYYALAHTTADKDRILEHANEVAIQTDVLQWSWPGAVNASIGEGFRDGKPIVDPEGVLRRITDFSASATVCEDDTEPNPALVVRPKPPAAAAVRQQLHAAADFARTYDTHYRWFAYTFGNIGFDPPDNFDGNDYRAPIDWALDFSASVSSVFIWHSLKASGIFHLEGLDLEPNELAADSPRRVELGRSPGIRDGLYHYDEAERREAGEYIYNRTRSAVLDKVEDMTGVPDWFPNPLFSAESIAAQFTNCFAIDYCGPVPLGLLQAWRSPGEGDTASPDNFFNWDAPETGGVLGDTEPLLYRSGDYRRIHVWTPALGTGALAGEVELADGTKVEDARVTVAGRDTFSLSNGAFEPFEGLPAGQYELRAEKLIGGVNMVGVEFPTVVAGMTVQQTLVLTPETAIAPPGITIFPRNVSIDGVLFVVDDEESPIENQSGDFGIHGDCEVSPLSNDVTVHVPATSILSDGNSDELITSSANACVGDEVMIEVSARCRLRSDNQTVDVDVTAELFEGDSCPNGDEDGQSSASWVALPDVQPAPGAPFDFFFEVTNEVTFGDDPFGSDQFDDSLATVNLDFTNEASTTPIVLPDVQPVHRRLVEISGTVDIIDSDWPDPEDTGSFPFFEQCIVDPFQRTQTILWDECVDEVRVEITATCTLTPDHQSVNVDMKAELFEGTTCISNDIGGRVDHALFLLPEASAPLPEMTVANFAEGANENGGSRADLNLTLTNHQQP
jgi:hypothetical protein